MNDVTYRQGLRAKGFNLTTTIGSQTFDLSLSGLAKSFEFFQVVNGNSTTLCTLTINIIFTLFLELLNRENVLECLQLC